MKIGYMRPFQEDMACALQLKCLKKEGCERILIEGHSSAKKRTELEGMIDSLQSGDQIVVTKLFVLADSTRHLVELLEVIEEKGACLKSLKEGIDTDKANSYPFSDIVKHLADFQSDMISDKTKKGLTKAKQNGTAPGRPRKPDENVQRAIAMYESKQYSLAQIKEKTGISKSTLYRYLES